VRPDHLVCLDCGQHFSMLKRHFMTDHELTPEQYRQRWQLSSAYPMVTTA
jgi:predicted transcriptional regulator